MTQDVYTQIFLPASIPSSPEQTKPSKRKTVRKLRRQYAHPWFSEPYNAVRGEQALWIAVITQAMMDALSRSTHPEQRYHKQAAIQWLTGSSKDFYYVCMLAGMEPSYV